MRILVVEDEERSLDGLSRLIESIGPQFKVVGRASNGEKGLQLIEELWPDVVFTDICMPGMDGFQLIHEAEKRGFSGCSFVLISAHSDFSYVRQAFRFGVVDYILKPVSYEEIEKVLFRLDKIVPDNPFSQGHVDERYSLPENASPIVRSAVEMIRKNYASPLSLNDISSKLGVSIEHFSQTFSKQMSITFTSYLKNYRIDVAKRLLLEKRWKMQDIAAMTGYQNPKYFSRVFRDVTGMSPSEFIAQYNEGGKQ